MTTPEVQTIKRNGSRFYVDPVSGAKVPSVTSIVGCLPKRALQFWRGKMVAECAVEDFGVLADFVSKGNTSAAIDHLKRAPDRSSGVAAKTESDVHALCAPLQLRGQRLHLGRGQRSLLRPAALPVMVAGRELRLAATHPDASGQPLPMGRGHDLMGRG